MALEARRSDFPLLAARPSLAYLDNAATTQKPQAVIDALASHYRSSNATAHRAVYGLAEAATAALEDSRRRAARFIGAAESAGIVFTHGATEALNLLAHSLTRALTRPGDGILLSEMEHHSNLVPWQRAAAERGLDLRFLPVDANGRLALDEMPKLLGPRTRIVSLTHTSNALGSINPVAELAQAAHAAGAVVVVDAAQAAGHTRLDVEALACDFLVFSGHKCYGPMGIGALWGRQELLDDLPPWQTGGGMISSVWLERAGWNDAPYRFEAGTPNVEGAVGLAAALAYLEGIGIEEIEAAESGLTAYALARLAEVPGLAIHGPPPEERRGPIISFSLEGVHAHDAAQYLDRADLALRSGHHCAQPLMRALGLAGTLRASLSFYNSREEIDRLAETLTRARRFFRP